MKKFIIPVINLVALVLSAIIFGLGANSAVYFGSQTSNGQGNWYQLVWSLSNGPAFFGQLGFFLFIAAVVGALLTMIAFKHRRFVLLFVCALFVGAGVMILLSPESVYTGVNAALYHRTDSLIAMGVLAFVAAFLECVAALVDFLPEKK